MPVSTVTSHEPKRALDRRGAKQRGIYFFLGDAAVTFFITGQSACFQS
jgi:hypothetical protein